MQACRRLGEKLYADLVGPMPVTGTGQYKYVLTKASGRTSLVEFTVQIVPGARPVKERVRPLKPYQAGEPEGATGNLEEREDRRRDIISLGRM